MRKHANRTEVDAVSLPGYGPTTTIGRERVSNLFATLGPQRGL
jgi:hypothetical protein